MTTLQQDIETLESRIAKVENERDIWRVSGPEEKYYEAYFLVQTLELQLEQKLEQKRQLLEQP